MKRRNGFVSNSSSSSFVILMGKGFNLTDEDIQKAITEAGDEDRVSIADVRADFEVLKNGRTVWDYDNKAYYSTKQVCKNKNIIIGSVDGGPDDGKIVNLFTDENVDIITRVIKENEE